MLELIWILSTCNCVLGLGLLTVHLYVCLLRNKAQGALLGLFSGKCIYRTMECLKQLCRVELEVFLEYFFFQLQIWLKCWLLVKQCGRRKDNE